MIPSWLELRLTALRNGLGVGIVWLSIPTAFPHRAAEVVRHPELGAFVRGLALVEILGAVLLLIPKTVGIGASTLISVFVVAVGVHVLHGEWQVGHLVIYTAATAVFLAPGGRAARDSAHRTVDP